MKLVWYQLDLFLTRLRALRGANRLTDGQLVAAVFLEPRYLWITRDDVVAQAVSWWRAKTARAWEDDDLPVADAVFDYGEIDRLVGLRGRGRTPHGRLGSRRTGLAPLHITYEELVVGPAAVARCLLVHLGIAPSGAILPQSANEEAGGHGQ